MSWKLACWRVRSSLHSGSVLWRLPRRHRGASLGRRRRCDQDPWIGASASMGSTRLKRGSRVLMPQTRPIAVDKKLRWPWTSLSDNRRYRVERGTLTATEEPSRTVGFGAKILSSGWSEAAMLSRIDAVRRTTLARSRRPGTIVAVYGQDICRRLGNGAKCNATLFDSLGCGFTSSSAAAREPPHRGLTAARFADVGKLADARCAEASPAERSAFTFVRFTFSRRSSCRALPAGLQRA